MNPVTYTVEYICDSCDHFWSNSEAQTRRWTESCPHCGEINEPVSSVNNLEEELVEE